MSTLSKSHHCLLCLKSYTTAHMLNLHIDVVHNNISNFCCDHCDHKAMDAQGLKRHKLSHAAAVDPFKCKKCDKSFLTKGGFYTHTMREHLPKEIGHIYGCDECDNRYASNNSLVLHKLWKHSPENPFACELCEFRTKTQPKLKLHTDATHKGIKPVNRHQCDECDMRLFSPAALRHHKRARHTADEITRIHECMTCHYKFKQVRKLNSHNCIMHCAVDRCGKSFWTKSQFVKHCSTSHSLSVDDSSAMFDAPRVEGSSDQRVRRRKVAKASGGRMTCMYCLRTYTDVKAMERHMAKEHEGEMGDKLECTKCAFACWSEERLAMHTQLLHAIERPHKCETCDVKFKLKAHLVKHLMGRRAHQWKCGHGNCAKAFARTIVRDAHEVAVHGGVQPKVEIVGYDSVPQPC